MVDAIHSNLVERIQRRSNSVAKSTIAAAAAANADRADAAPQRPRHGPPDLGGDLHILVPAASVTPTRAAPVDAQPDAQPADVFHDMPTPRDPDMELESERFAREAEQEKYPAYMRDVHGDPTATLFKKDGQRHKFDRKAADESSTHTNVVHKL